jgi:anti-sigma factor RsiW
MNCQRFQKQLYEHVEGSLGPAQQAAAEEHLAACARCRELVSREQTTSRVLSCHLREAVAELTLRPEVTNRVLRTLEHERLAEAGEPSLRCWRPWMQWRVAAGFGLLVGLAAIGLWIWNGHQNTRAAKVREQGSEQEFISVQASYVVPVFTSRREGSLVIDTVIFQTNHVRQILLAEAKARPPLRDPERKHPL